MFIVASHQTNIKLRKSGMFRIHYISLLTELDSVCHLTAINIALLRSFFI